MINKFILKLTKTLLEYYMKLDYVVNILPIYEFKLKIYR
jgi:hypothetical protein